MMRMGNLQKGSAWPLLTVLMTVLFLLGGFGRAEAQVERLPVWAVVEFENKGPQNAEVGKAAAAAVAQEFGKRQTVDVLPLETANRTIDELGLKIPITRASDLSRLGLALEAGTVISGEVVNFKVDTSGSEKQANVLVRVFVRDVASGITINGAAVSGRSGFRASSTEDSALLNEALGDAAFKAVQDIESRRIPSATVTSTLDGKALLDRGLRDGLKANMNVIVTRAREQVAVGRITSVDDDSALVTPNNGQVFKGIRTGDKVRVVFDVPTLSPNFSKTGEAQVSKPRSRSNNQGLIAVLVLVVILGLLLGGGRSGSTELLKVSAKPFTGGDDVPSVRLAWTRDTFLRNNRIVRFQVWRDDIATGPVAVTSNVNASFLDDRADLANAPAPGNPWGSAENLPIFGGSTECAGDDQQTDSTAVALQPGRPYRYSVEVVYRINSLDLPGEGTTGGGTGGTTTGGTTTGGTTTGGTTTGGTTTGGTTTGGTTTGGTTTGGTTTGGGNDGEEFCYFLSTRVASQGAVTPFRRTPLRSPIAEFPVAVAGPAAGRVTFQYESGRAASGGSAIAIEYVIQVSPSPSFSERTTTVDKYVDTSTPFGNAITRTSVDILAPLNNLTAADNGRIYWRVGIRNTDDSAQPDGGYIFSTVRSLKRADTP